MHFSQYENHHVRTKYPSALIIKRPNIQLLHKMFKQEFSPAFPNFLLYPDSKTFVCTCFFLT